MSNPEISIPTTATSPSPKPHTIYNISLRLPLRSFTLPKRYSDFLTLHTALLTTTSSPPGTPPPAPLPPKSYFSSTLTSAPLCESRRSGLEAYLRAINTDPDSRWRDTSAWRTFLNLPSSAAGTSAAKAGAGAHYSTLSSRGGGPVTDPVIWLDQHRALKALLHDARLALTRRDQADATSTTAQHEAGVEARRDLVRAGTVVGQLEGGLKGMGGGGGGAWGISNNNNNNNNNNRLGEGEVRRRRDLLASARREREGLENLLGAMVRKERVDGVVAGGVREREEKKVLFGEQQQQQQNGGSAPRDGAESGGGGRRGGGGGGRVLGAKETEKTKQLDNQGVLQLQQTMMSEQDEDVMVLAKAVARQKELGIQIQEELVVQNELLGLVHEDVERVQGKLDVARERVKKIS